MRILSSNIPLYNPIAFISDKVVCSPGWPLFHCEAKNDLELPISCFQRITGIYVSAPNFYVLLADEFCPRFVQASSKCIISLVLQ